RAGTVGVGGGGGLQEPALADGAARGAGVGPSRARGVVRVLGGGGGVGGVARRQRARRRAHEVAGARSLVGRGGAQGQVGGGPGVLGLDLDQAVGVGVGGGDH